MNIWCIYIYAMYDSYKMLFADKHYVSDYKSIKLTHVKRYLKIVRQYILSSDQIKLAHVSFHIEHHL